MEKILFAYCKDVIEDFSILEKIAFKNMDKMRVPLYMACPELYNEMSEAIENYCDDNEIDNDFDVESVFFAC